MYKQDLTLNNQQGLIWHKTQHNQPKYYYLYPKMFVILVYKFHTLNVAIFMEEKEYSADHNYWHK